MSSVAREACGAVRIGIKEGPIRRQASLLGLMPLRLPIQDISSPQDLLLDE